MSALLFALGMGVGCSFDWDGLEPRSGEPSSAGAVAGGGRTTSTGGGAAGTKPAQGGMAGESPGTAAGAAGCAASCPEPEDVWLWWVDSTSDRVSRAPAVAAATPEVVVDLEPHDSYFLRSLVVDTTDEYVYFSDSNAGVIRRAGLDGSDVRTLVPSLDQPMSLALDLQGGKLYWVDQGDTAKVQRANLDGSGVQDLVVDPVVQHPYGLVLDPAGQHLYFIDNATDKLQRCDLDGSNVTDLKIANLAAPIELALDLSAKKIYWSDLGEDGGPAASIRRANLDGSSPESVVTTANYGSLAVPLGLDLDVANGKLYFVDGGSGGTGVIVRANLDGSNVAPLIVGLPSARGLKVVLP